MASEIARLALAERLKKVIGEEPTETLMEHLPPTTWDKLATKEDLEAAEKCLLAAFAETKGELRGEFGELRGEFGELRGDFGELRGEFAELRGEAKETKGELRGEFAELRGEAKETKGELALQIARQTRIIVFVQLGIALTIWIALLAPGLG